MWFILINRVWKQYLKRKRHFSLFCDSLPVWEKSYFWDGKLPGGYIWRHLPKESTWYLLKRDRDVRTTSSQTDRQSHFIILDAYDNFVTNIDNAPCLNDFFCCFFSAVYCFYECSKCVILSSSILLSYDLT